MDAQKVDMFIMTHANKFESFDMAGIRNFLEDLPNEYWHHLQTLDLKSPINMLIISFLGGTLGIDRLLIGDIGLGIAKLFTCGGLGIWAIVDLFLIQSATKRKNLETLFESF